MMNSLNDLTHEQLVAEVERLRAEITRLHRELARVREDADIAQARLRRAQRTGQYL
jgi:outer membrane murein-binding lipoprotein Lpp